jgi:cytochrome d ubiquinol oxidase subunit II
MSDAIRARWFGWPNTLLLAPVPVATALLALALWRSIEGASFRPFACAIVLFLLSFLGLGISLWPYIVPPVFTVWDAAAAPEAQRFLLIGVGPLLPLVLGYTVFSYWVFRGKVREGEGYHH